MGTGSYDKPLSSFNQNVHTQKTFSRMHPMDLRIEDNKGKAMVGEIGVFIFCVTIFDFEKCLNGCQAPMLLLQRDPGLRYFLHENVEWSESRH